MRIVNFLAGIALAVAAFTQQASATVSISIDLSSQRMHVVSGDGQTHDWSISSARSGFSTPRGSYKPISLQTMHYSRKYNMAPMPHSIFFHGGYAIHGTNSLRELGRPASHGCVRLAPGNATALFEMVKREGARISIAGSPPGSTVVAYHHKKNHHHSTMLASRHLHGHALAYSATHKTPSLKQWQHNPAQLR